jgi:flagellar FliL protein
MATAPKTANKPEEEAAPAGAKSKKKTIIILAIVMLLLGGGGAAAWWLLAGKSKDAHAQAKHVEPAQPPVFLAMEPFTVNLQTETSEQFLQVAFTVQVHDEKQVDQMKLYMPQLRSRLLMLLSSKKASEISTVEGKKKLTDEILAQMKQPFSPGAPPQDVSNVFFTSFVIQ